VKVRTLRRISWPGIRRLMEGLPGKEYKHSCRLVEETRFDMKETTICGVPAER
jgi:hypothetical protein